MTDNKKHCPIIGIDIGSRSIKLFRPATGEAGAPVCASVPVPDGAIADGFVARPAELAAALSALLSTAGVTERHVVSALSGSAVVVRPATMPRMKGSELVQAARWEAQRHIPLPLGELIIDCVVCGDSVDQPGMVQVMIAGGQRRAATALAATLAQAGLTPVALDADALAAYRALAALEPGIALQNSLALLDVGGAASRLWMYTAGLLQVSRVITVGADHLIADFEPACQDLVGELRRSVEFVMLRGKRPLSHVCLLGGGGAAIPELAPAAETLLNAAFSGRLAAGERLTVTPLVAGDGPEYTLAYGLTLWEGRS